MVGYTCKDRTDPPYEVLFVYLLLHPGLRASRRKFAAFLFIQSRIIGGGLASKKS